MKYPVRMLSRQGHGSQSDPRVLYKKIFKSPKHRTRGFHATGERVTLRGVFTEGPYLHRGKLMVNSGYFHVLVEVSSQKYTLFVTQEGEHYSLYVPFGISNSPAVFTRFIMAVLSELIKTGDAVVYMDDIIIPSKDVEGLE